MIVSFKRFLEDHKISARTIAAGVSGGSDSLALVIAAHEELAPLGYNIVALTVDHGLRPSSAQEAEYVGRIMQQFGIEHHILVWNGDKPDTGIEEAARQARYAIMAEWCAEHQIENIFIAHQMEEQAETFFMRMQRGSGLDGLCGMREVGQLGGLTVLRPLLKTSKQELQTYLRQKNISWVEDESNFCNDFLRARIRKFMPEFYAKTGISATDIVETMERLQSSQNFITKTVEHTRKNEFINWHGAGYSCPLQTWKIFDGEIKFRLLAGILKDIGQATYIPRAKKLSALIAKIEQPEFKSSTLGGCEVTVYDDSLWITPQKNNTAQYTAKAWQDYIKKHPKLQKRQIPYKMRVAIIANERTDHPSTRQQ